MSHHNHIGIALLIACVASLFGCGDRQSDQVLSPVIVTVADQKAETDASVKKHDDSRISYNRDIRPILSDKCFACHGPDRAARAMDLRLDVPEDGEDYFGSLFVIEPGEPDASEVIHRIYSKKSKIVMPPPAFNVTLTDEEKSLIERWIKEGAVYEPHWSFVPLPEMVEPPTVKEQAWPLDELDRFVLTRLEKQGIAPNTEASRQRWIRRVTYDLIGLPPTPEEVAAFVGDKSEDAYEEVVDRLLASPHYGEHMTTQWTDLARYADSYGYQADMLSPTWHWRDWAIRAFNRNLPYDQFIIQQIAGDLLPNATREQRLATAFNRLHRMTNEGGSINEEWLNEYTADRVHTFGTAFMGLTFECARCHDHRYDPIEQQEYYQLYAFFNSIDEHGMYMNRRDDIVPTPSLLLPTEEQDKQWARLKQEAAEAATQLQATRDERSGKPFQNWLNKLGDAPEDLTGLVAYYPLDDIQKGSLKNAARGDAPGKTHGDNKIIAGKVGNALRFAGDTHATFDIALGALEPAKPFTISFWIKLPKRFDSAMIFHNSSGSDVGFNGSWFTIEDGKLRMVMARFWPGNALAVQTREEVPIERWVHLSFAYDGTVSAEGMQIYIDGEPSADILRDKLTKHTAHRDGKLIFDSRMRTPTIPGAAIDELRLFNRALTPIEAKALLDGQSLQSAIESKDSEALKSYYLSVVDEDYAAARKRLISARSTLLEFQTTLNETMVMEELPEPTPAYNLARGAYNAPKTDETLVIRDTPNALPPMPKDAPRDRLGLAKWLTDPGHPLTARVAVNRLWMQCFGEGLVSTPDNFGLQGALPSHPELLDYLAREFMDSGWDTKAMLKRFVLSATYRQDSTTTAERWKADPGNALLSRGPSRRLTAEQLRDTSLASSGLLNDELGGPPVAPYQPPKLWRESNTMTPAFKQSVGKDLYRRSIYTVWKRTAPMPNMIAFDAPGREVCSAKRSSTNTPIQALVLLNDVQFVEACRVLAERVLKQADSAEERLAMVYLRLTGAEPDQHERELLLGLLERQRAYYADAPEDAKKLAEQGESKRDESLEVAEVASWVMVIQAVMNSDDTVWRR